MPVTCQRSCVGSHPEMNAQLRSSEPSLELLTRAVIYGIGRAQKQYDGLLINIRLKISNSAIPRSTCLIDHHWASVRADLFVDRDHDSLQVFFVSASRKDNCAPFMGFEIRNTFYNP